MTKKSKVHGREYDEAFKREAVRILSVSGRTIEQVAADLGVGRSSLSKWKSRFKEAELMAGPHDDMHKELARLRRENELLRAERDLLKKATAFFAKETSR
jgi:transposase